MAVGMRTIVLAMVACVGCAGPAPRDLSNATLSSTQALPVANTRAETEIEPAPAVLSLLAAPDRLEADRALDAKRQAADVLTFLAVPQGGRVAELACGAGYGTELLARAVGPSGVVYGENPPGELARRGMQSLWTERLERAANANVVRVDRELVDPLPRDARGLDLVYLAVDYREVALLGVDRDAMNHAIHLALRRGGRYVVMDQTPLEGPFVADLHALHTEESRNARREIESAGFTFAREGRFFRESSDPSAWEASPRRGRPRQRSATASFWRS